MVAKKPNESSSLIVAPHTLITRSNTPKTHTETLIPKQVGDTSLVASVSMGVRGTRAAAVTVAAPPPSRDWYFPGRTTSTSTAHPEGCAVQRIVLVTVPRVSRSCDHFPDGFDHPPSTLNINPRPAKANPSPKTRRRGRGRNPQPRNPDLTDP